jgi:flagellar hook-associated protein 1 FlgK
MSISNVMQSALSGMNASQQGLRVTSQNISNVNTPGAARAQMSLEAQSAGGYGVGVDVSGVRRAADQFLSAAAIAADASRTAQSTRAGFLDRAQLLFGDPASGGGPSGALDRMFASFASLQVDPSSSLRKGEAVSELEALLAEMRAAAAQMEDLRVEADGRIGSAVRNANDLLQRIHGLNGEIQQTRLAGQDATGAENVRASLMDELGKLLPIRVVPQDNGVVEVRSSDGVLLVGQNVASLSYQPIAAPYQAAGSINITIGGATRVYDGKIDSGEIGGLLQVRDRDLPGLADGLGALAAAVGDALNSVYNDNTRTPPPAALTGRDTGLLGGDLLNFTGRATLGLTNASGELLRRIQIDFDARTISVNGAPGVSYNPGPPGPTIAGFTTALNNAMSGVIGPDPADLGVATFANGVLSLASENAATGLVVQQDGAAPSARGGRGFGHFFGLQDLVKRDQPLFHETGLSATDAGFASGALIFRIRGPNGQLVDNRTVAAAPASIAAMVTAMNDYTTGLGAYGQVVGPDAQGRVQIRPHAGYSIELANDTTVRTATTPTSASALFGWGDVAGAGRASDVFVDPAIVASPPQLAVGRADLGATLNTRVIEAGDSRGAQALAAAKDQARAFTGAGLLPSQNGSIARFAAALGGEAGQAAMSASRAADSAQIIYDAANQRRSAVEGIKLDDELINMTRYQQSYSAAARLIQAAQEMFDTLLQIR